MTKRRVWHSPELTDDEVRKSEQSVRELRELAAKSPPNPNRKTLETHFIVGKRGEPTPPTAYDLWKAQQAAKKAESKD